MSRKAELIALLISDTIAAALSCLLYLRIQFGENFNWLGFTTPDDIPVFPLYAVLGLTLYWIIIFLFFGMYRERYAASRFDELVSLAKVVTVGVLVLVFAIFIDTLRAGAGASIIFFYWGSVLGLAAVGRIVVRSIQKALILRGYGLHKTLIVGWSDRVEQLYRDVARYPAAGLQIVGAIRLGHKGEQNLVVSSETAAYPIAGGNGADVLASIATDVHAIEALPRLIDELDVQDVLISLGSNDQKELAEVLRLCDGKAVSLKLVPDFYSVIGGMARTEHVYGLPLIEVLPVPMPAWEQSTKRMIDFAVVFVLLVLVLPLWLAIGLLVRLTSPGPAIYRQQRVGQKARVFTMYKFRTMRQHAEAHTGPVWATEDDPRYTRLGRWLRKTRLDEIPQLWNVLKGDMSLVGPRPERPFFVEKLTEEIPFYTRRHRVKPGITGWAQVMWRYDTSLDDVKQKVKFDLFYIENMSLRMDFKILFRTIRTTVLGKGQ
ncbi:MAG: sugar transferase [Bacteroidetes bacterium]|nr:sugar transferase [Bacteroidota bacterium]